jgi:serine/threonine protein kinase
MEAAYSVSDEYYIPITLSSLFEHCLFSPQDSADISLDILEGLKLLHSNNLAHRDIKPDNIILIDNKIKICDVSLIIGKDTISTAGTEYFMPQDIDEIPEEYFGIDCDLFATGKVLYAMLNNDENITMFPYIDKKILCDKLARKINLIINKACSPSYKDRYSSSLEFIQALLKAKAEPKKLLDFF